jgi:S-adenosylhomocysteine hydrolase
MKQNVQKAVSKTLDYIWKLGNAFYNGNKLVIVGSWGWCPKGISSTAHCSL